MPTKQFMQIGALEGDAEPVPVSHADSFERLQGLSSAHFLKLVEERGEIGFWSSEFTASPVRTSIGLYRIYGVDPTLPLFYKNLIGMIHPADRPFHEDMMGLVQSGQAIDREFRIVRPDHTVRWVRNRAEAIVDARGHPVRAIGVMFDVTADHEARQSVERGIDRYRTLMQAIAAVVWKADRNGVPEVDPAWCDLTGQTHDQASGLGWLNAVHPDDRDETLKRWQAANAQRGIYQMDHRICCADGIYRWLSAHVAPVLESDGTVREWVGAILKSNGGIQLKSSQGSAASHAGKLLQSIQIRAARALLDWSLHDLAKAANISISSIRRMESDKIALIRQPIIAAVRKTLEEAGVEFTFAENGQPGVRLR